MGIEQGIFQRNQLLMGQKTMQLIAQKKIIIFGLGGVGSWCAESLVRSGFRQITLVDSDRVCITNVNRQLIATSKTVGQVKTELLKQRLLEINPNAHITALQQIYDKNSSDTFGLGNYDFIIDAIDSLENKVHLIREACKTKATLFSSMGAALKLDPTRIKVAPFWKVQGCPLAAILRRKFKQGELPARKFMCVYSDELLVNAGENESCGTKQCLCPKSTQSYGDPALSDHEWCSKKARINGTTSHIPAMFGFTIAGLVVMAVTNENKASTLT